MSHAPDTFAIRLIKAQNRAGLGVTQLAHTINTDPQSISRMRVGKRDAPTAGMIIRLCRALNCSADYLLGLSDDPQVRGA